MEDPIGHRAQLQHKSLGGRREGWSNGAPANCTLSSTTLLVCVGACAGHMVVLVCVVVASVYGLAVDRELGLARPPFAKGQNGLANHQLRYQVGTRIGLWHRPPLT